MKKLLAASLVLSAVSAATAQIPNIRLFFTNSADPSNAGQLNDGGAFVRDHWSRNPAGTRSELAAVGTPGAPTVRPSAGEFLYLWMSADDGNDVKVLGMNVNVQVDGGNGQIAEWQYYGVRRDQSDTFSAATVARYRWEPTSVNLGQGTLSGDGKEVNGSTLTAVQTNGLANNGNLPGEDTANDADRLTNWDGENGVTTMLLGAFRFTGSSGQIWIELGANGVATGAGQQAPVFLGGATASIAGGIGANGRRGSAASATIVPEPASLLLLGLAGLAIRRR